MVCDMFALLVVFLMCRIRWIACQYAPIVNELEQYVAGNQTFAYQLNQTFIEENNQSNTTFVDLYNMFNYWLTNVPQIIATNNESCNGVYSLVDVVGNYADTKTGTQICRYNTSILWMQTYLNDWKTFLDSNQSAFIVNEWMKCINMTEYIPPKNGYLSFNQFFTREINMTYRPIAGINNNSVIVSPGDGSVRLIQRNINLKNVYNFKGEYFNITELLNNNKNTNKFIGGDLIQFSIYFTNYHRYHSPISGHINEIEQIAGWYYCWGHANSSNYTNPGCNNRRGVVYTSTRSKNKMIATVHIGQGEVSSINYKVKSKTNVEKGDEIGHFAYGGSTIILLFEPGYIDQFVVDVGQQIQVGQQIATTTNFT